MSKSTQHILFESSRLTDSRIDEWGRVLRVMPSGMVSNSNDFNLDQNTMFMLYGIHSGSIIVEWADIYHAIANHVYSVYRARTILQDDM